MLEWLKFNSLQNFDYNVRLTLHRNSGTFYFYFLKQIIPLKYRKYRLWPSLLGADDSFLKYSLDLTNGMLGCIREHNAESTLSKTETTEGDRIETLN